MFNFDVFGYVILGVLCLVFSTILFMYYKKREHAFEAFLVTLDGIRQRKLETYDDICYLKRDVYDLIKKQGNNAYMYCLEAEWKNKFKYRILILTFIILGVLVAYMNIEFNYKFFALIALLIYCSLFVMVMKLVETNASKNVNKEIEEYLSNSLNISNYLKSVDNVKD